MNCSTIRELLASAVDEALGTADRAAVDAHVTACPACLEWMSKQVLTVAILRGLGRIEEQETPAALPESLVRRILAARADEAKHEKRGRQSG